MMEQITVIPTEQIDEKTGHPFAKMRCESGEFKGVLFQIGAVSFPTMEGDSIEDQNGNVPMHIEFNILEIPNYGTIIGRSCKTKESIECDPAFHQLLADIVVKSISQMIDEKDVEKVKQ